VSALFSSTDPSPVLPCERCALHAQECKYEPTTLTAAWDGDTLTLPKCACCPDEEGCWHVLGGKMIRPRVKVFEAPEGALEDELEGAWRE
jgi:NAD-dependent SIR2 family protein deacetylase